MYATRFDSFQCDGASTRKMFACQKNCAFAMVWAPENYTVLLCYRLDYHSESANPGDRQDLFI